MQELINMGVDTSNVSMYWYIKANPITKGWNKPELCTEEPFWPTPPNKVIPTFTLQDILEMLPNNITIRNKSKCRFSLEKFGELWLAAYIYGSEWEGDYPVEEIYRDIPIEAAFEMLKWCKQNNYI